MKEQSISNENLYAPNLSPIYILAGSFVVSNVNATILQAVAVDALTVSTAPSYQYHSSGGATGAVNPGL